MDDQLKHYEGVSRTDRFKDGDKLSALLQDLSTKLKPIQQKLAFTEPCMPVGCIVGNPRSGTTLFQQWLASLGAFSYPTNLLTRFAYAPYIGALTQKMLFDPDFDPQGDFSDLRSHINFESDIGKSQGAMACNEFQHFFRNYMPNFDLQWLDDRSLEQVDCVGILKGLASIESAFGKPFTTKGNILQFNIPYMAEQMPCLFWMHIVRAPLFNMQSILFARERYYGDRHTWWSVKPKEYEQLKDMDVYHQIAGQVFFTEKAIAKGLRKVPETKQVTIEYKSFCSDPHAVYLQIVEKYLAMGYELPSEYKGPVSFKCSNELRLATKDVDGFQKAYDDFNTGSLELGSELYI